MRVLKLKAFQRMMKINDLNDTYLKHVLEDVFLGRSVSLGSKLYKIRASRTQTGKSAGYRNIFFWEKDEYIIFIYLFAKNVKDNITAKEFQELKILAEELDHLSLEELKENIKNGDLMEVKGHD